MLGHANAWFRGELEALGGAPVVESRGRRAREVLHEKTTLPNPRKRVLTQPYRRWNPFFQIAEPVWILTGSADADWIAAYNGRLRQYLDPGQRDFHGAYGHRLRRATGRDQLKDVLAQLRDDPGSRRAVAAIHLPDRDHPDTETLDRPCNIAASWLLREGKLNAATFNRSNDFVLGLPTNIVQFTTVQEFLAAALGVDVGDYTHFSSSLHVYEDDAIAARVRRSQAIFDVYDYVEPVAMRAWRWPEEGWVTINKIYAGMPLADDACPYWQTTSLLLQAWRALRDEKLSEAMGLVLRAPGQDWAVAALEFVHRWAARRGRLAEFVEGWGVWSYAVNDYILHDDGRD